MYESTGAAAARMGGGGGGRVSGGGGGGGFSRPTPVRTVAPPAPVAASMPPAVRTTAPISPWGGARPSWGGQRPGRHDTTRPSWTPGWSAPGSHAYGAVDGSMGETAVSFAAGAFFGGLFVWLYCLGSRRC
jgi:hypothetical protein